MLHMIQACHDAMSDSVLRAMFAARKRVFVDLLQWNVPVLHGRYEIDQFDDNHATYLVLATEEGRHLGSTRLLSSVRSHILGDLFPELCDGPVPRNAATVEITRFCLDRDLSARERRGVRDTLVTALVGHALATGISRYTAIAEMGWVQQILSFGWTARPLGLPRMVDGAMLSALEIEIAGETPALLRAAGIHARPAMLATNARAAA